MASKTVKNVKKTYKYGNLLSGALSYGEWLQEEDRTDEETLLRAKARSRSDPAFGKSGEKLRQAGLADDGYAAVLHKENAAAGEKERKAADRSRLAGEEKTKQSYAAYLSAYAQTDRKSKTETSSVSASFALSLAKHLINNKKYGDAAYEYCRNLGLSESDCERIVVLCRPSTQDPMTEEEAAAYEKLLEKKKAK